jgi:hypothetical protein
MDLLSHCIRDCAASRPGAAHIGNVARNCILLNAALQGPPASPGADGL